MTDEPERELTPEEDARIRSLLASARTDATVPDDVAARLDAVLAELIDTRTDRAPQRRRRLGPLLLGAAAASVAALVVLNLPRPVGDLLGGGGSADSSKTTASSGAAKSAPQAAAPTTLARLNSNTFRRDVSRLLADERNRYSARSPGPTAASDSPENGSDLARGLACPPASRLAGVVDSRDVLLDGKPALLEVFGVTDGSREVRVVSCDGVETLATARIPAP